MAVSPRWVIPAPKITLVAGVADMVVSNDAGADLVTYSLGSCLGITVYDPQKKIGGLLHLMLPDSQIDPAKASAEPFMFADTGVPRLFQAYYNLGGDRRRAVIKAAGGAAFFSIPDKFNIGERNVRMFDEMIRRNGLTIDASDFGGYVSRTLRFDLATGTVTIHSPANPPRSL